MKYYKLDLASLPDALYNKETSVKEWLSLATSNEGKFPPSSLNKVLPIDRSVEIERIIGLSGYIAGNVFPLFLPWLFAASFFSEVATLLLRFSLAYYVTLIASYRCFVAMLRLPQPDYALSDTDIKGNQYAYPERNNQKYTSMQLVWSESMQRPALDDTTAIFCAIPHGAMPMGISAYPLWSKLFNDRLCHWTCAPVVLKLPVVSAYMRRMGYIPAKSRSIVEVLTKKEENVGIILDGVAGMFQSHDEVAYLKKRKGVVKIALRAGVPLVPVYGFGHTKLWNVVVDPFRILEKLSIKLDVSICPIFGRFGWFLGPAHRVPLCVCVGEPVKCPKIADPSPEDIDTYHGLLVKSYRDLFEQHKEAYGWGDKKLKIV